MLHKVEKSSSTVPKKVD